MEQHIARTATYTDAEGNPQTYTYYEAQQGTRGGASYQRWYTCVSCKGDFPERQIVLLNDVPYCTVNQCAEQAAEEGK